MDVVQERLEREYNLNLITTAPSVVYKVTQTNGEELWVDNPAKLPDLTQDREDRRALHQAHDPHARRNTSAR